MKRPTGLTIISVFHLVIGIFLLGVGLAFALSGNTQPIYIYLVTIIGAIYFIISIGLFMLKNWARITAIVMFSVAIIENVLSAVFIHKGDYATVIEISAAIFRLAVSVVIIVYLLRKNIKSIFNRAGKEIKEHVI